MSKKVMVQFFYDRPDIYGDMAKDAINSFKHFHPDVDVFVNTEIMKPKLAAGVNKIGWVYKNAIGGNYDKVISLGCDTITLSRLDEFMDDDETDVLATFDYNYPLVQAPLIIPANRHVNADVVCFNNLDALRDMIKASPKYSDTTKWNQCYHEQAGLNEVLLHGPYSSKIVDRDAPAPYYNVGAKAAPSVAAMSPDRFSSFTLEDNKIMTPEGRQIKLWHYCEGFGTKEAKQVKDRVYHIKREFSEHVQAFMREVGVDI